MNREIKFRGQRIDTKEWVYGYYFVTPLTENAIPFDLGWYLPADIVGKHCIVGSDGRAYVVMPETVGQFTNLPDKNGREIYENDSLKTTRSVDGTLYDTVIFDGGAFKAHDPKGKHLDIPLSSFRQHELEIIGNIRTKEGI